MSEPQHLSETPRLQRRVPVLAFVASAILFTVVAVALFAPLLAPFDPNEQHLRDTLQGPSSTYWLGTDNLGRDVLSRVIFGARIALVSIGIATGVSVVLGVPIGLVIGFRGGRLDSIVMRIVEAFVSVPGIMIAVVITAMLGAGLTRAMFAIGLIFATTFLRLARGLVISEREELYVRASRVAGASKRRLLFHHVLPNVAPPLIVQVTLIAGAALLAEAGLSFIGIGAQPPEVSWGTMLSNATEFISLHWWLAIPPGVAITLTVLAINVVGDHLRDSVGRGIDLAPRSAKPTAPLRDAARGPTAVDPSNSSSSTSSSSVGRSDHLLQIDGLGVSFRSTHGGEHAVITDLDLHIDRGETLGLVGESGCGKSLTAWAILGLIPPPGRISAGSVRLDDVELVGRPNRMLESIRGERVAMIFQDSTSSLDPAFTVGDQITEVLRSKRSLSRRAAKARATELLDLVGIADPEQRMKSYPHEMSGGMAQRVAIARALSCEPDLLVADEPTTALDVTVQSEILDLLRRIQNDTGMAMLFITHDLGVAADICDRVQVMYAGEAVESTAVDELFAQPAHPYTEGLMAAVPSAATRGTEMVSIAGTVPLPGEWPTGCRFAPRCPYRVDACEESPVALAPIAAEHAARCRRMHELELNGST